MRNRRRFQSRRGITLLFVVSMIVLFLLMGTTFVIVSNDYLRASPKRARVYIHKIDGAAFLDRAFYDLVRGPELTNTTSPLRGQDLLSDQYGYGFRAYVTDSTLTGGADPEFVPGCGAQLFRINIASDTTTSGTAQLNETWDLLKPDETVTPSPLTDVASIYNGLVLTFTSGPAAGISTRIVNHEVVNVSGTLVHWFTLPVMEWNDAGNTVSLASLVDSEIIVNGREFSGTGAGRFNVGANSSTAALNSQALEPNRVGETLTDLRNNYFGTGTSTPTGFTSRAPNESYDAADFQNMFLAGRDSSGDWIPSWHRDKLATYQGSSLANDRHMFAAFDNAPLTVDSNNDGTLDALWVDLGMPIQSNDSGIYYKPLVAYTVVDLDGRLNLNAHGNLTQVDPTTDNYFIDGTLPVVMVSNTPLPRGQGWGPPEVDLGPIFSPLQYGSVLSARYGPDGMPGDGGFAGRSRAKLFGHPFDAVDWSNNDYGTVGNLFASSPMDLHGRFAIGTPAEAFVNASNPKDRFRDLNIASFPNAMPIIDMLASQFTGQEFTNSPYEMSFAPSPFNDSNDQPFAAQELEKILRPNDLDSNLLASRLWDTVGSSYWINTPLPPALPNRDLVTTASFEIPITYDLFKARLRIRIASENGLNLNIPAQESQVEMVINDLISNFAIAPELFKGLKFNVNRPFGNGYDDDGDGVVDNPAEALSEVNIDQFNVVMDLNNDGVANNPADFNVRIDFARQLYLIALLATDNVMDVDVDGDGDPSNDTNGFQRTLAQWAVNVVDFRDPDSIMTKFVFDPNPFDLSGWNPNPNDFVWGCERPELLLTETFAAHPRRTEDFATDSSGPGNDVANGDMTFDQGLRPEPIAFFELYNPWTQNSLNQQLDASLYDNSQGVVLDKRSLPANGATSPVWRISIERPDDRTAMPIDANTTPLRYVYFADPDDGGTDTVGDDDNPNVEVFFSSFAATTLRPGSQALVGTLGFEDPNNAGVYRNFLGRLSTKTRTDEATDNLELDRTRHIGINPDDGEVTRFPVDPIHDPRYAVVLPIDVRRAGVPGSITSNRPFSVSDRFGGYPDVDFMGTPAIPIVNGDGFRYVISYDVPFDTNTDNNRNNEDIMFLQSDGLTETFRIVRLQRLANPLQPWDGVDNPYITVDNMELDLITFNGVTATPEPGIMPNSYPDRSNSVERGAHYLSNANGRTLWDSGRGTVAAGTPGGGDHYYDVELVETLGKTNDAFTDAASSSKAFPWLTWNNRPFVSHLELVNVPYTSPESLTKRFTIDDPAVTNISDPYSEVAANHVFGRFGHLLNFFSNDRDVGAGNEAPNLFQIMDYLEVPSRFLGTESNLNVSSFSRNPYNFLSRYRVPGKINLNTIYDVRIWQGLISPFYATTSGGVSWIQFKDSRQGSTSGPTDFHNPFRPAGTGNYVPPGVDVAEGPDCTLFREGAAGPLFDFTSPSASNDTTRSAYFRNAMRMRLGNLVTTRSSVFAIWITVGYFEVDEAGNLKTGTTGGVELGSDTGEVQRNRAFYIFDRSIPVAFEPGKNHNVDRAVLVKSIIE